MDVPVWKTWLSYLFPLTLEEAGSEQNPALSVRLDQGRLQLLSGDAIYSWDDLYRNFTNAFERLHLEKEKMNDVLLLGLGLGSVPYILEKKHGIECRYVAVEWDETVAELASKYTLARMKSPVEIVVADAELFVDVCDENFDMIVIDIFEDSLTPPAFETPGFIQACLERLKPNGLLLYNRLYNTLEDKFKTDRFYEQSFRQVFPDAWYIDTGGNWILCARN